MMFALTALILQADAQNPTNAPVTLAPEVASDLKQYCPAYNDDPDRNHANDQWRWEEVPADDWYWEDDWDELLRNRLRKDGSTMAIPSTVPGGPQAEIYPAGFKLYQLPIYSEPPICQWVPNSRDKKVEILLESNLENANLCIHDVSYNNVGSNSVGNIENCGSGKIYACFTAATVEGQDFGFYVSCETGCEDMFVDVWMRIRVSTMSWDDGKEGVSSDLEHWCEGERGAHLDSEDITTELYYQYPSDLIPDKPSKYPFHIHQIFGGSPGSHTRPSVWLTTLLLSLGVVYILA